MAGFDGTGTYTRFYDWTTDRDNGIKILASRMDEEMDMMATGFNLCFLRDGRAAMTGTLAMGTNKITGIADGLVATPSLAFANASTSGIYWTGTAVGISNGGTVRLSATTTGVDINGVLNVSGTVTFTTDLAYSNLAQGSARSVLGVTGNATADLASIQGTANQVLRVDNAGTGLAFGAVNLAAAAAVTGTLPVANGGTGTTTSTGTGSVVLSAAPTLSGTVGISQDTSSLLNLGRFSSGYGFSIIDWVTPNSGLHIRPSGGAAALQITTTGISFASGTTASAANLFQSASGAGNEILRSTSSARYKTAIVDADINTAKTFLGLRAISYKSTSAADDPQATWHGFIAEDADAAGLKSIVNYAYQEDQFEKVWVNPVGAIFDDAAKAQLPPQAQAQLQQISRLKAAQQKRPDGFQYERTVVFLQMLVKDLYARLAAAGIP